MLKRGSKLKEAKDLIITQQNLRQTRLYEEIGITGDYKAVKL